MNRAELLERICFTDYTNDCSACDGRYNCSDCKDAINPLLDEYDKQIRADGIDKVMEVVADIVDCRACPLDCDYADMEECQNRLKLYVLGELKE